MVRPLGKQLLRRRLLCALRVSCAYRVMWHNGSSRCSQPIGMKKLSRSQPVINTGHYQRFKHPHVTRSPPIGIAKLTEVFMNICLTPKIYLMAEKHLNLKFKDFVYFAKPEVSQKSDEYTYTRGVTSNQIYIFIPHHAMPHII